MRKAGAVTQKEIELGVGQVMITSTDLKSRITFCNQAFIDVSGFSEQELLGEAHNILRHADMPQLAFKMLWDSLKAGKPWMGVVKNRCKMVITIGLMLT